MIFFEVTYSVLILFFIAENVAIYRVELTSFILEIWNHLYILQD